MSMDIYTPNESDIIHSTKVDFVKRSISQEVHLVQYDNLLPIVEVELFVNNIIYTCPENAEVFVRWCNKDLSFVYKKCKVNTERTKVYFEVDSEMTPFKGKVSPILELNIGDKSTGSSPMIIIIDRNSII